MIYVCGGLGVGGGEVALLLRGEDDHSVGLAVSLITQARASRMPNRLHPLVPTVLYKHLLPTVNSNRATRLDDRHHPFLWGP